MQPSDDFIQDELTRMRRELQEMQRKLNRLEGMDPYRNRGTTPRKGCGNAVCYCTGKCK